jgi:excisionase family DNA binding protein
MLRRAHASGKAGPMVNENPHRNEGPQAANRDGPARAAEAKQRSPFLTTAQAAHYVGLSRRTLEKMRCSGLGPQFRKHGRYVRYHIDELEKWSAEHRKSSTAEPDRRTSLSSSE